MADSEHEPSYVRFTITLKGVRMDVVTGDVRVQLDRMYVLRAGESITIPTAYTVTGI